MAFDMIEQDPVSRIDQQVSVAVHELVVTTGAEREEASKRISALLSERVRLTRPPVFDRIERLLGL